MDRIRRQKRRKTGINKMNFNALITRATDKGNFQTIQGYIDFAAQFLDFIEDNLQARIVSRNEPHYQFLQYKEYAEFQITRPINTRLMLGPEVYQQKTLAFNAVLETIRSGKVPSNTACGDLNRFIYTLQQTVGLALDGLPIGRSNRARKLNGDLFEQLVRLVINQVGIPCVSGTVVLPVQAGTTADADADFKMNFQQDLIVKQGEVVQMIGSVKTSSKDRLAKIFMDKLLFSRLTNTNVPHIAVFLHDVQRKGKAPKYGVNATFLPGHFKAFTVKINPLDGVYYFDLRPNMKTDKWLKRHIRPFDRLICEDIWRFFGARGVRATVREGTANCGGKDEA